MTPWSRQKSTTAADLRRVRRLLCGAVLDELDADQEPLAADVADRLVAHQSTCPVEEISADIRRPVGELFGLHDLDVAQGDRSCGRVAAIGVDLGHLPVGGRIAVKAVEHLVLYHRRGNRQVGAGNALGDGDDIGRHAIMLVREHLAGAAEAVDDLVHVQKDAVFAAEALDLRQVFVGRHRDADPAHDRLDDHLGDSLGPFALDRVLHVLDTGKPAARIAEPERAAVAIGRGDMDKVAGIGLELCLALAHAARIERGERGAVIGEIAAHGFEAVFARIFVLHVLPGDLEAGLVRLGAGIDKIGVIAAAHQPVDLFREPRGRRVHCGVREIRQLAHLLGGDLGELAAAIADIDAPQPGHGVEILGAVGIDDCRALAAADDHLLRFQGLMLDDRVQDAAEVLPHHRFAQRGIGRVRKRHDGPHQVTGGRKRRNRHIVAARRPCHKPRLPQAPRPQAARARSFASRSGFALAPLAGVG